MIASSRQSVAAALDQASKADLHRARLDVVDGAPADGVAGPLHQRMVDEQELPDIENAKELYSLPLTTWIWLQPWAAANNHVNFIKRSARNSLPTQSGISAMAAE